VNRIHGTIWLSVPGLAAWLALGGLILPRCAAQDAYSGAAPKPSFTQSIKDGFSKVGETIAPSKPKASSLPGDDPTLLSSNGKPSVELYLALAKYYEESNKPREAEQQYQKALQEMPNHLVVMLSYAHFMENQGRYEDAVNYYQVTMKAHPKDASVYNNLALCYARKKKLKEATSALVQAVQLEPRNPLYRNNVAAILVEQNRLPEAFEHLRSVHGDAKAYYNLGYMLSKKGDTASAEHHFKQALAADPTFEPAQRWLAYLQNKPLQPSSPTDRNVKVVRPAAPPAGNSPQEQVAVRIAPPPEQPAATMSAPQQNPFYAPPSQPPLRRTVVQDPSSASDSAPLKRLPPIVVRQPAGPASPGDGPESSESGPPAPLPPGAY